MTQKPTIIGKKFGRLLVVSKGERGASGSRWNCVCDCGGNALVVIGKLNSGATKSCGCIRRETTARLKLSHGNARQDRHTSEYERWKGMIQRCTNPRHVSFKWYGERGITVCDRWMKFENFLSDMGQAPARSLIDRIHNDGNYEPGNCRWTDPVTSARNRRPKTKHFR